MHSRALAFPLVVLALGGATATRAAELSADCKPVYAALEKSLRANHATATTMGSTTMRAVTVDGVSYLEIRGAWTRSPLTVQETIDMSRDNLKNAKAFTCKALPDAVVDGVPVATFATHTVTDDTTQDSRISIAKSTGLVIFVQNQGVGDSGTNFVTHYGYSNVKAPI